MAVLVSARIRAHRPVLRLTSDEALRYAWCSWAAMLAFPFLLFLSIAWALMDDGETPRDTSLADTWFVLSMAYLIVALPLAIFWRSHVFKAFWYGFAVPPHKYLVGMLSVWVVAEIGGVFSLLGCLVTRSLIPNLLPAVVAFMLFIPLWPSGRAMTHPVGHREDPEIYEEPR